MLNKAILIGNVGADPEIRSTQAGEKVANISLATTERWSDKNTGEKKEKTEWHRVILFGKPAGVAESYIRKGSKLYVEGKIQTRKWDDSSGVTKYSTEIVLSGFDAKLVMLDSKSNKLEAGAQPVGGGFDDEIPF